MYSQLRKQLRKIKCRLVQIRHGLGNLDSSVYIARDCKISHNFIAEEYVYIGPRTQIATDIAIGRYTMVGPNVIFTGDDHMFDKPGMPILFSGRPKLRHTRIGRDVWIGANSIILAGVTIEDGAIIAAGTVVSRDVPACEIHACIPNKKIRDRFSDKQDVDKHLAEIRGEIMHGNLPSQKKNNND